MSNFNKALKNTHKIYSLLKKFNFEGTSLPGKFLRKYYPEFFSDAQNYAVSSTFAITGTNGKTTTAGILAQILKEASKAVIHNELGANMPNGIATALALGLFATVKDKTGAQRVDNYVIECDEAYLSSLFKDMKFDYLLITNLFRDQLDRYGELDITKRKIQDGIDLNEDLKLIINADDPTLSDIDKDLKNPARKKIYFGIESIEFSGYERNSKSPLELIYCSECKTPLNYNKRFYSQLGDWYCICGNKKRVPDVSAKVKMFPTHSFLNVTYKEKSYTFKIALSGLYNAYNALGAISAALVYGVERRYIDKALENYKPAFGRAQQLTISGKKTLVYLIKNPVGASEVLRGLRNLDNAKILISINDNYADGRDISWLWDADFESLKDFKGKMFLTGTRADDMALRLKYANCDTGLMTIDANIKRSLKDALNETETNEKLIILTTYTSLLKLTKLFKNMK